MGRGFESLIAHHSSSIAFTGKIFRPPVICLASRAVKILVVTNLYPPHHAGTFDLRCESVVNNLKLRGHPVRVLTSTHGMRSAQEGGEVERRLLLNGVFSTAITGSSW